MAHLQREAAALSTELTVNLTPRGLVLRSDQLLFASNHTDLGAEGQRLLLALARVLHAHAGGRILVGGHSDTIGDAQHNLQLSLTRAQCAADILTGTGLIPKTHVQVRGFGETEPVAANDSDAGRRRNRRVELTIEMEPQEVADR